MEQEPGVEIALPLHDQVSKRLQREIKEKGLIAHSKIPSEVDIAEQYHVSRGTVTKAINTLVQQGVLYRRRPQGTFVAASALDPIQPIYNPRQLTPEQGVIGLIVPYLSDSFLGNIVTGIETLTRTIGYSLNFACSDNDWTLERYHIEQFIQRDIAGVIIFPSDQQALWQGEQPASTHSEQEQGLWLLRQNNIPFVLVDRYFPNFECDYVVSDDLAAGYMATQHLVSLGYRRIGFVSIAAQLTSNENRYKGYTQCLEEYNLTPEKKDILGELRQTSPASMPGGIPAPGTGQLDRNVIRAYLQRPDRPEAIVVLSDYVALRILQVAEELGLDIPRQLAVVSCGGSEMGIHARVPLTSVMQSPTEIGRQAAHILNGRITHNTAGTRQVIVPVSLSVRRSCGAIQPKVSIDPVS